MNDTTNRSRWHPRRWHLLTWMVFLLWLVFTIIGNYPHSPPATAFEPPPPNRAGETMFISGFTMVSGWPIFYLERHFDPVAVQKRTVEFHTWKFIASMLLIAAVHFSIVVVLQRVSQFSIKLLLAAITLVAVIVAGGKAVAEYGSGFDMVYYIAAIYHLPLLAAIGLAMTACWQRLNGGARCK